MLGFAAAAQAQETPAIPDTPAASSKAGPSAHAPLKAKRHFARRSAPYKGDDCCGEVYRYIYAEAWYGNQKLVAPVRRAGCCDQVQVRRAGCCDQVQVPGGAWITCEFTCEITIRKMRLDYWQDQGAGYDNERSPGYPREDNYTNALGWRRGYLF